MRGAIVLFEPLPIARIGVRLKNNEVIFASDFSTFAFMIEEFVSLGVVKIAIPQSSPEAASVIGMPPLLKNRVVVINDSNERDAADRILYPLLHEIGIFIDEESKEIRFSENVDKNFRDDIRRVRQDITRLALGFNHHAQVSIDPKVSIGALRRIREHLRGSTARSIVTQMEGVLSVYEDLSFDSVKPDLVAPKDLISVFDRLVNDESYLNLSESIGDLAKPSKRRGALSRVREYGRNFTSNSIVSTTWNYAAKVVKVVTGAQVPEMDMLTTLFSSRSFPMLTDHMLARERALQMWLASGEVMTPCNRFGVPYTNEEIYWLPPLKSLQTPPPNASALSLGTVDELLKALKDAIPKIESQRNIEQLDDSGLIQ